jgi:aspartyl aminopeptidase
MMSEEKSAAEVLQDKLCMKPKHVALVMQDDEIVEADKFCDDYKKFITLCKTEREAATFAQTAAKKAGFVLFDSAATYKPGDKVYYMNRGKAIILTVFGKKSLNEGVKIIASHIDAPRVDL